MAASVSSLSKRTARVSVLDEPLASASVGGFGGLSASTSDESAVRDDFADALAARPDTPAAFVLYFEEGTTVLVHASKPELDAMFAEVERRQAPDIQVTGHTDRVGKVEDNDYLGFRRAQRVRSMLIELGLNPEAVSAVSRGEREPLVPTEDEVEEPRNRRVEVTVR